jgi:zinc D-Ala-D-Ala carboxypeptidase
MIYPTMLSKYMSFEEATRSQIAERKGIKNVPNAMQLKNMQFISRKIFDPVREFCGAPTTCSSFLRVPKLNQLVGSTNASFHVYGAAIDIKKLTSAVSYADIFKFIRENLMFSELIWEYGNNDEPAWVHVGLIEGDHRKMVKKATLVGGKPTIIRLV